MKNERQARIAEWFKVNGGSMQEALQCWAPDEAYEAALLKMVDAFLMPGDARWAGYPCQQTQDAKRVIAPFIRGSEPADINSLRTAFIIQNMNLREQSDAIDRLRKIVSQKHNIQHRPRLPPLPRPRC